MGLHPPSSPRSLLEKSRGSEVRCGANDGDLQLNFGDGFAAARQALWAEDASSPAVSTGIKSTRHGRTNSTLAF